MRKSWLPAAFAAVVALILLWLADAPLERASGIGQVRLTEPAARVEAFPRRFAWEPVPGADAYEITVGSPEGRPLFRQRGTSCVLDLVFEPGAEPAPGDYLWEVRALRRGRVIARGLGSFRVAAEP